MRRFLVVLLVLPLFALATTTAAAQPVPKPAQYCKVAAPPQFFNACVVCAAHGAPGPAGDGPSCICKTIMSGFFGTPAFESFGDCMQEYVDNEPPLGPVLYPAQYCKAAAPPEFFNACVVCAAHGSPGPAGDGPICICKTIMSGFFGPPAFKSFGECMNELK